MSDHTKPKVSHKAKPPAEPPPVVKHCQPLRDGTTVRATNLFNNPKRVIAWIERASGVIVLSTNVPVATWDTDASRLLNVPIITEPKS